MLSAIRPKESAMPRRALPLLCLPLLANLPAWVPVASPAVGAAEDPLAEWAGTGAVEAGFTEPRVRAFLEARAGDLRAGSREPWAGWLKGLDRASSPPA